MAGVETPGVFALRLAPNCVELRTAGSPVPLVLMAVIVLEPEVRVVPNTLITYPEPALVLAAIWEVAMAVSVGLNRRSNETAPEEAVVQSGKPPVVPTVPPVQKT